MYRKVEELASEGSELEDKIWFWEEGYHGEEIISLKFFESKPDYIHLIQ